MNRSTLLILISFLFSFLSCSKQPLKRNNKIQKITFATGGECWEGGCPYFAFSVDSSLNYIYFGGKGAKLQGYYKGSITQSLWDTINIKFENLNKEPLNNDHKRTSHPSPAIELFVYKNNKVQHIADFPHGLKDDWYIATGWLKDSVIPKTLLPTMPIAFESTVQHPNSKVLDSVIKKYNSPF
ncbi:DUF6438 domain-containing protein [Rubrolithibacter danxiaensis]|uniref:DUF6438 domain-containing protein n=1 Tax=Rubrolithibacter danxiaensis TaxID=3390805 RepID=UPI003BF8BCA7